MMEDVEQQAEAAAKDCRQLASCIKLMLSKMRDIEREELMATVIHVGSMMTVGQVVEGTLALHQNGESLWW